MKQGSILFFLLFSLTLFAQKEVDVIDWSANRKLVWDDFLAAPQKNSEAAALTATHLGFSFGFKNNNVVYNIDCRFDKTKSWGLVKNDWILAHEQGHFDIAEIFARKLNKEISGYKLDPKTYQKDLDVIYSSVVKEKEAFQQQYDDETNYSRNRTKQEEWLKKIDTMLNDFKAFANYK